MEIPIASFVIRMPLEPGLIWILPIPESKYLLPSEKVKERFMMYGVSEKPDRYRISLPKENIGENVKKSSKMI